MIRTIAGCLLVSISCCASWAQDRDVRLTLPPTAYSVVGAEIGVYFDNLILVDKPDGLRFEVKSNLGKSAADRWLVTPRVEDVGTHDWSVAVFEGDKKLAEKSMKFVVNAVPKNAPRNFSLLLVGDSLTHATVYPNEVARRLKEGGDQWTLLGTHRPLNAAPGVAHEGYGGWRWDTFQTKFEAMPDPAKRVFSSPFLFATDSKPVLDVPRYFREKCEGRLPDFVVFKLGINDCFSANPEDPAILDKHIDGIFASAEKLLAAFREAAPNCQFGICLTTGGNARDSGFEANYKGKYTRWGWKRIQRRLVERQLQHFGQREKDRIDIIPTELNLDPVDGYPVDNAVHPNVTGYHQIAASIHAWLVARTQPK